MADAPIKKYRFRRAKKWLKRTLIPFGLRASKVSSKCGKPDTTSWPPSAQAGVPGLARYEYSWLSQNGEDGIICYRDDITVPDIPALTSREAFRPHANWLGRGISEAEQLEIMQSMPYQEV